MSLLYIICATAGSAVLVFQFAMSLLGWSDDGDLAHGDVGGDFGHDVPHDSSSGHDDVAEHDTHGSTSLFQILSVRTLTAALAFFGLTGLAAQSRQVSGGSTFVLALGAGFVAMYGVHWLMQQLFKLRTDGTVRLNRAIGKTANVYVRIPAQGQGVGKVVLILQNRTVELDAVSDGGEIPAGTEVVVQRMTGAEVVEVARLRAGQEMTHA
jgi:hypothetical protein